MGLVCNDRSAACTALDGITNLELPNQERLERMRGRIPQIQVGETLSLEMTGKLSKQPLKSLRIHSKF